jgi:hypothetical protein
MAEGIEAAGAPVATGLIIAKPGRYYRVARYLMTLLLMGYGAWSIYDGFYSWPNWTQTHPQEKPKTHTDIILNQILGCALPPMGICVLGWAIYNSRGEYRLENGVLSVPGHPPIPLEKIQSVNREAWDRKGIAVVEYYLSGSDASGATRGKFRLDDFVYDREPTDMIFKAIEESLLNPAAHPQAAPTPAIKTPPRPKMGGSGA